VRDILIIFVVAVLVSFLIKTFVVRSFYIPSASMENTLQINDRIIVNELEPSLVPVSHGDVVVFRDPGGWLPPEPPSTRNPIAAAVDSALTFVGLSAADSNDHLIKRVIGLPGDRVTCCNALGQISVNGTPLKEPYILIPPGQTKAATLDFDVTVPQGELWVMGDNRYNSQDSSRNQNLPGKGFVPIDHVVGRAFVISWPLNRWTWLDDYPDVFRGVEDSK
jgi:signal peptidase I